MIVMHMSGAYRPQNFYKNACVEIDCTDIAGTRCYCDETAKDTLRLRIKDMPAEELHFLDSGNYHYLSLLWLEKIKEPFSLVLFDNHPDMQTPSFGEITSCGGWVKEALETNPYLQTVYIVGANEALLKEAEEKARVVIGAETLKKSKADAKGNPLYLSFDKDVLRQEDARCDWDQGKMSLSEAMSLLSEIARNHRILGMDVCGEESDPRCAADDTAATIINDKTNRILADWYESMVKVKKYKTDTTHASVL